MTSRNYTTLDFESYYNSKQGYSLRKMTVPEYVLDPRFECIGCAIIDQGDAGNAYFAEPLAFKCWLKGERERQKRGEKLIYVSHNALFDMCLLVWRFGLVPDFMIDTMAMSQALLYPLVGFVSLDKISNHLQLPAKGKTIMKVDGMTGQMIRDAGLWDEYCSYATHDAVLCREIFKTLRTKLPPGTFMWQHMVTRCAVKPKFVLDRDVLHEHLNAVKQGKLDLLHKAGLTPDADGKCPELMSNVKFREVLEGLGVEIPMKISPATGKLTEAFAKADQGMADLEEHDDPMVQAVVAARQGVKSTLEETRTQRLIDISNLDWPHMRGQYPAWMPMPLKASGAHTHRLSGTWKINVQNFPRGGRLRDALRAPPGHVVVTCDASQIEARLAAWLAAIVRGEHSELVDAFARGDDVYSLFATKHIYNRTITKKDNKERFVGKQAILGLGFGMGHVRYRIQVRKDSRLQLKIEIILTEDESKAIVNGYRFGMAPAVPKAWATLNSLLPVLQRSNSGTQFGPVTFGHQEITGPTGLKLFYHDLGQEVTPEGNEWRFTSGRMRKRMFGGKLYENIIQHLAFCCNDECAQKVERTYGRHAELASQSHDELIYVVPGEIEYYTNEKGEPAYHLYGFAAEFKPHLEALMCERPVWGPTLPLAAESGAGLTYGDAK